MVAVSAVARPDIHLLQSPARAPYRVVGDPGAAVTRSPVSVGRRSAQPSPARNGFTAGLMCCTM